MKNIIRFALLAIFITSFIFYSCQKEAGSIDITNPDKPHAVTIFLTDHQTPVFDSVFIDLQKLEIKLSDDSLANGGWVNLSIRPGVYNILRFRNGLDTLFATGTIPNARLKKIKLTLGSQNSVVKDGVRSSLRLHDNDREVMIDVSAANFEITSSGQVLFWIDFDASQSIQVDNSGSGNNNGYRLRSHIKIFTRRSSGSIEGRVLPRQADALVMAINGTDTTTAIPEDDRGEFKIVGLNAGTYKVFIDGQNGYNDTTINNVIIRTNEDTHLPVITLHQ